MSSHQVEDKDDLARLGNQVSHTLPMPPLPALYRAGVPCFIVFFLAGFGYFSLLMTWERAFSLGAFILAAICLLLAALSGASLYRRRTRRWALTLYEHGIALQRGGRTRTFLFEEIRELAIREREQFDEAVRYGVLREVTVKSADDRLIFHVLSQDNPRDTAGLFLEAVRACLSDMAGRRLRAGESLTGKGWTLTHGALHAAGQTVPLGMLSEAELYGDRVAVWKSGEEMPYFSVPAHASNALVLLDVLAARLPRQAPRSHGLGRALFEKRTLLGAARGFRVHERAIVKLSVFGHRQLLFSDVERMSCRTTRHYHNGVYTGTSFGLRLHPREGQALRIK
ncbi:MAG TPA: hypothetical protein VIW92_12965, partial [Thermoanaerobaculia bacterium]